MHLSISSWLSQILSFLRFKPWAVTLPLLAVLRASSFIAIHQMSFVPMIGIAPICPMKDAA
jgi:hypothetical protein